MDRTALEAQHQGILNKSNRTRDTSTEPWYTQFARALRYPAARPRSRTTARRESIEVKGNGDRRHPLGYGSLEGSRPGHDSTGAALPLRLAQPPPLAPHSPGLHSAGGPRHPDDPDRKKPGSTVLSLPSGWAERSRPSSRSATRCCSSQPYLKSRQRCGLVERLM
jgi:hypothetical protein